MALSRRANRNVSASIWPGFVDAMTALLLVLMFVLTIFMVVQFVLRETISGQESELDALSAQVRELADALGLERDRNAEMAGELGVLNANIASAEVAAQRQAQLIATLNAQIASKDAALADADTKLTAFEAQVAALIAARDEAIATGETLTAQLS
ncbi:MAG: peptidoglycan-binding protein, partial [Maritimibacter sp.]|nr:peptidoglycan-binding protein [Maritimibacter sp.]